MTPSPAAAVSTTPTQPQATPTPATVTVAIYNGTTISGLANKADSTITQGMTNAVMAEKKVMPKAIIPKTQVIDLSGNNSSAATQIAKLLGGSVASSAPSGEAAATLDILVITELIFLNNPKIDKIPIDSNFLFSEYGYVS